MTERKKGRRSHRAQQPECLDENQFQQHLIAQQSRGGLPKHFDEPASNNAEHQDDDDPKENLGHLQEDIAIDDGKIYHKIMTPQTPGTLRRPLRCRGGWCEPAVADNISTATDDTFDRTLKQNNVRLLGPVNRP